MALTTAMLVGELGMGGDLSFEASVDTWWTHYSNDPTIGDEVRYLQTKLKAIDILKGIRFPRVDWEQAHTSQKNNQAFQALVEMRKATLADLEIELGHASASRQPEVGQIITQAPLESPPTTNVDPNARRYRGDAIRRSWPGFPR